LPSFTPTSKHIINVARIFNFDSLYLSESHFTFNSRVSLETWSLSGSTILF